MPVPHASLGTADVVVLGGGIIGTAIAERLSALDLSVILVEAGPGIGAGSSGRCDGNVLLQTKHDDLMISLTRQSVEGYRRWTQELDLDIRFEQTGSLLFFTDNREVEAAKDRAAHLRGLGLDAEFIDGDELKRRESGLCGEFAGAIDCHDDAEVYPPSVVAGLAMAATRQGCRIILNARAERLIVDGTGRVTGVDTSAGMIAAPYVVNALGAWSPHFRTGLDLPMPVVPRQGVLVVTQECPELLRRNIRESSYMSDRAIHAVDDNARVAFSAEPTYRGNILIGSSRRFCGYDISVDFDIMVRIMERATMFLPALRNVQILRTFAGLRPWTPDSLPLIGETEGAAGYILATGHEGEGIGLAPITAEMVAACILNLATPPLTEQAMKLLSPDRFASHPPVATPAV